MLGNLSYKRSLFLFLDRMHKTKEVRSACGTDIHTPAEPVHQEEKQLKKNDLLLQVVKSNNFQKLLSSRSKSFRFIAKYMI